MLGWEFHLGSNLFSEAQNYIIILKKICHKKYRCSIPGKAQRFFSCATRPGRFWGLLSLLFNK